MVTVYDHGLIMTEVRCFTLFIKRMMLYGVGIVKGRCAFPLLNDRCSFFPIAMNTTSILFLLNPLILNKVQKWVLYFRRLSHRNSNKFISVRFLEQYATKSSQFVSCDTFALLRISNNFIHIMSSSFSYCMPEIFFFVVFNFFYIDFPCGIISSEWW